ncbi:ABC transporter permease [Polymorphobacter arshaanensis]|uniref:ABC transporter permease n=1 Tax=Glacieibacterium arshaanense TaxID=2511025 RepID=UPI001A9C9E83|nr:ABC transporter permease [Polymorphobacter arshaanensis]
MSGENWRQERKTLLATLGPPLFWLTLFFLVPLAVVWAYSFGRNVGLTEIEISGTFANYAQAIQPLYLGIFFKSIVMAAACTVICLVAGFPVALAITFAPDKVKAWLLLAVMLPFWTNLLIRTYALIAVLRDEGYINLTLGWIWKQVGLVLNVPPFVPLEMLHNNPAVLFGLVYVHLPFMVLPLYAALDRLDRSLIEASLDLGAGHFRTMMQVVVPLALPGILSGVLITFIPALGAYLTPDLLGGPDSQMIANVIERQFKRANDWPFGAALSFLLLYLTFVMVAVQALIQRRRGAR